MKRRLSYGLRSNVMGNASLILGLLLSVSGLCLANSPASDEEVSTTVSVSLVAKKISTTSVTRIHRGVNATMDTSPLEEAMPFSSTVETTVIEKPSTTFMDDSIGKLQKIKKKILVSNLRNGSEKFVLPSDDKKEKPTLIHTVINVTEGYTKLKDGNVATFLMKTEKTTQVSEIQMNKTMVGESRRRKDGAAVEGRSLDNSSSRQNITVNFRKKTRVLPSITEQTTNGYAFGEPQKLLASTQAPTRQGQTRLQHRVIRPSPTMTMPTRKLTPISTENSLKNAIRFDSTSQTDWMPIVPGRLPIRPVSTGPYEFTKLTPVASERTNATSDNQSILFPSEAKLNKETNGIPVRDIQITRTTELHRSSADKMVGDPGRPPPQDPGKFPIRFRGAVKYKSNALNGTSSGDRKYQEQANDNKTSGPEKSMMEIPGTGASWTLATLKVPPPVTSALSAANHTHKPALRFDGGLIVPPETINIYNVTKDPNGISSSRATVPGTIPADLDAFSSKESTTTPFNLIETWTSMKIMKDETTPNETMLDIPGSLDMTQASESTPFLEIMKVSTPQVETTSIDISTTENVVTTESPPQLITAPKTLKLATETTQSPKITHQTPAGNTTEDFTWLTWGELSSTEFPSSSSWPSTFDSSTFLTALKTTFSDQEEGDPAQIFPEVDPKLVPQNNTTSASPYHPETVDTTSTRNTLSPSTREDRTVFPIIYTPPETTTSSPSVTTTRNTWRHTQNPPATDDIQTENTPNATLTSAKTPANVPTEEITTEDLPTPFIQTTDAIKKATTLLTSTTLTTPWAPPAPAPIGTGATTIDPQLRQLTPDPVPSTTTATYKLIGKPETTEDTIYYKDYIPTTVNFRDEITEENVPAYLRLTVQTSSWKELCSLREPLREAIMKMLAGENVTSEAVHFLNLSDRNCQDKIQGTKPNGTMFLPVNMFLMDQNRDFDKNLSEAFLTIWGRQGLDFDLPIRKVDFVTPIVNLTELYEPPLGGSVVAAIVISCVAGICVILLGILFVIMKRRQKRFNYGQRCTPVSLDAYSLDSVSIYNSVRRKGMRASKRSYGNAAFDDSEVPSHPMNFAGLANFSSVKEHLYEEFNIIPQVYPKVEELPEKAETKNRYANVIPIPETRVHLSMKDGDSLSDYINANYVRGNKGTEKLYIACQAPMESTVKDFWRMIWEVQCKVILMLTDLQENGIEKCADYLPPNEVTDNLRLFGDYQVTLKKRDVKDKYIISNLTLKNMETNLWREVIHLWYLGWPDQGVPPEANSLIAFLIEARSQMKTQNGATTTPPAVVHCSPGTGRTGTVIACDLCIREYEQNRMVDIPKCVFNIRRDRAGAVQTKDQYAFIYQVLNVYATKLSGGGIESI